MKEVTFGGITPVLRVTDMEASTRYYVDILGFRLDWPPVDGFGSVSRGKSHIFLCEHDQGNPGSWIFVGVSDADELYEQLKAKGARIRIEPQNFDWSLEMQVEDLDGNVLRMGSDPVPGRPAGLWLDMRGVRWQQQQDGSWEKV